MISIYIYAYVYLQSVAMLIHALRLLLFLLGFFQLRSKVSPYSCFAQVMPDIKIQPRVPVQEAGVRKMGVMYKSLLNVMFELS